MSYGSISNIITVVQSIPGLAPIILVIQNLRVSL